MLINQPLDKPRQTCHTIYIETNTVITVKQRKILFSDATGNIDDIIEDQLGQVMTRFEAFVRDDNIPSATCLYQEYADWIESEEGENVSYLLLDRIKN